MKNIRYILGALLLAVTANTSVVLASTQAPTVEEKAIKSRFQRVGEYVMKHPGKTVVAAAAVVLAVLAATSTYNTWHTWQIHRHQHFMKLQEEERVAFSNARASVASTPKPTQCLMKEGNRFEACMDERYPVGTDIDQCYNKEAVGLDHSDKEVLRACTYRAKGIPKHDRFETSTFESCLDRDARSVEPLQTCIDRRYPNRPALNDRHPYRDNECFSEATRELAASLDMKQAKRMLRACQLPGKPLPEWLRKI